jgi:peptide/nickel transport system permease protein
MLVVLLRGAVAAAIVMVAVAAITFTMLHVLRPEAFFDPRPLGTQLLDYLERAFLHFDLDRSREPPHPFVAQLIRTGLPADVSLLAGGVVVGFLLGVAGGVVAAARRGTFVARAIEIAALLALCAPVYWVGLMLLVLFAPVGGQFDGPIAIHEGNYVPIGDDPWQWLKSLYVPWIVLGMPLAGMCVRMMRASGVEALQEDFIRTARAKGLGPAAVLRRHVVPAGAAPTVALAGANMALMVTNLILVEQIFNVPGVFRETTLAMNDGDMELLQGLVIVGAFLVVVGNFIADALLAYLDPRVRDS